MYICDFSRSDGAGQRDHAEDARADALGDRADRAALAGAVAAFEQDDHAKALVLHPGLQVAEFGLKPAEFLLVELLLRLLLVLLAVLLRVVFSWHESFVDCIGSSGRQGLRRRQDKAAAEREVEVDALHALFGLHAEQRRAVGDERDLPLFDGAQVAAADLVARARQMSTARWLSTSCAVRMRSRSRIASSLAMASSTSPNARRPMDAYSATACFLLFGANLDLRLERAAREEGHQQVGAGAPHRIVAIRPGRTGRSKWS